MKATATPSSKWIAVIFLIIFLSIAGLLYMTQPTIQVTTTPTLLVQSTPIPTPIENVVLSPAGDKKLVMKTTYSSLNSKTYTFMVADTAEKDPVTLFTKTLQGKDTMMIPANSWSPDNAYVFVEENLATTSNIFVLKTSGESFANGDQAIDMTDLFHERTGNYIDKATGWASPIFIHMTTTTDKGEKGPTYWFDVTSQNFLESSW